MPLWIQIAAEPASLPAQGQARVLILVLGAVMVLFAGLVIVLALRRLLRPGDVSSGNRAANRRTNPRDAWTEAGRRASPIDVTSGRDENVE